MTKYLIDTHAHLDMRINSADEGEIQNSNEQVKEIIAEMEQYGVKKVIIPSVEVKYLNRISEIALKYDNVYSMVGIFPTEAKTYNDEVEEKLLETVKNNSKTVAVGEIGLDYYWDTTYKDEQQEVLRRQLMLARELDLPVILHNREATEDILCIVREVANDESANTRHLSPLRGVFHCFNGSVETARLILGLGFYVGIGGVLTFKKCKLGDTLAGLNESVLPEGLLLERLLLETDAPYMAPVPHRGERNESRWMEHVAERLTEVLKIPQNTVIEATNRNAKRLFGLK